MNYKLIGNNDTRNIIKTVLNNRGIEDYENYLTLSDNCADKWSELDNINEAVNLFNRHIERGDEVGILCDTDT